jgi:hypothetical protein
VGKVLLVYEISKQVLPTAPSPTVTHLMNLEALIFLISPQSFTLVNQQQSYTTQHTIPISSLLLQFLASITHLYDAKTKIQKVPYEIKEN